MKIELYIQPGAKKSEYSGIFDGKNKIRISSPPVEGAANKELIKFLSKKLKISKSSFKIVSGEHSRNKTVEIETELSEEEFVELIK